MSIQYSWFFGVDMSNCERSAKDKCVYYTHACTHTHVIRNFQNKNYTDDTLDDEIFIFVEN
jgi:hypothetical protein